MSPKRDNAAKSKRAARSERRRKQTRAEILEVARERIVKDGFARFTIAAVTSELGLTKPALYYYFPSKEALVFEVFLAEMLEAATEVEAAVAQTTSGADAVEALMRTYFDRYRDNLALFTLTYNPSSIPPEYSDIVGPEELARIRPLNDMTYGGAEKRLAADQKTGLFPKARNPRRFAFTAHMAVVGLLNTKAMVESSNDPLIHSDDDLIDDVVQTFRDAALLGGR